LWQFLTVTQVFDGEYIAANSDWGAQYLEMLAAEYGRKLAHARDTHERRPGAPETRFGLGGEFEEPQEESHIIATAEHSRGGPYGICQKSVPENVRQVLGSLCLKLLPWLFWRGTLAPTIMSGITAATLRFLQPRTDVHLGCCCCSRCWGGQASANAASTSHHHDIGVY
jgi:hypothetical protein